MFENGTPEFNVYIVWDKIANDMIGGLMTFKADAPAVRAFVDGLTTRGSILQTHPQDFALVHIGQIIREMSGTIRLHETQHVVTLDGAAWLASQQTSTQENQ